MLEIGNIQILLISDEVPYDERCQLFQGTRVVLTRNHCGDLGEEEKEMKKYQSATSLSNEIITILRADSVSDFRRKSRRRILGVYSPVHRIGKTTFTLRLGQLLAEQENVLYLNFETYAGIGAYFTEEEKDFSNLLYFARQEKDDISVRISSMIRQKGHLDYIPPMKVWTDLRFPTTKEWEIFFQKLQKESVYDTFLLDIGDAVSDVFELLSFCDKIIVPYKEDSYADAKIEQFKYMLNALNCQMLEDKIMYVNFEETVRIAAQNTFKELNK